MVRFSEKERHQIFIEPCGLDTEELYLQGISSSLPEDVQLQILKSIKGLENVKVMRTAYAIEYDCVNPLSLKSTLEFNDLEGLFGAGQFNGSSGYEEAAAQGLVAGINAALKVQNKEPFILDRSTSYIGTLIDDLVTKGCSDPYRMMTSRSEYRLILREDNADLRLTEMGYKLGLVSEEAHEALLTKIREIKQETERVNTTSLAPSEELNRALEQAGTAPLKTGCRISELLKRPQVTYGL
jgi:tRNA uridine 5-carboxymethylaminomethyl modification enzyme